MKRAFVAILIILKKDLKSELKAKESIITMVTFSSLIFILFSMAFEASAGTVKEILPGLIWMIFIFAGILGLNRTYSKERINDSLIGILASPTMPFYIYCGKAVSNLVFLLFVEALTFPILFIFYNMEVKGSILQFLSVVILGSVGFILVGTLLAALTSNLRFTEALLPVILFPLLVPVLLASIEATSAIIEGFALKQYLPWVKLILAYDLIFLVIPFLLFDYVLEVD